MFLSLSASRCKAQSELFSESCRVPVVLKEPETKGRKLQEPQTELTQFIVQADPQQAPFDHILNIYSKRNQSPSTNWLPLKLGVCYLALLSGSNFTGPH